MLFSCRREIVMELESTAIMRIEMLGGKVNKELLAYFIEKSVREILEFCNIAELPKQAEIYAVDWIVANYLTEQLGYSKQWEKMRENSERGLVSYRRMRW